MKNIKFNFLLYIVLKSFLKIFFIIIQASEAIFIFFMQINIYKNIYDILKL